LDDLNVKAIFCTRGGYGCLRIIDLIDFSRFVSSPKWIIGFSDITTIHAIINNELNTCSIHGPMPKNFSLDQSKKPLQFLKQILFGEIPSYQIKSNPMNRYGKSKGILVGGNLGILTNMIGTKGDFCPEDKVLFLEDTAEYLYAIDRMMISLKRSGKLKNLKALIVGKFSRLKDNKTRFGKNVNEIILDHVSSESYPVIFDFPAGHVQQNFPLILGANISVESNNEFSRISFNF
jgi:muramoyltetrapeptide carboxypeptidase